MYASDIRVWVFGHAHGPYVMVLGHELGVGPLVLRHWRLEGSLGRGPLALGIGHWTLDLEQGALSHGCWDLGLGCGPWSISQGIGPWAGRCVLGVGP